MQLTRIFFLAKRAAWLRVYWISAALTAPYGGKRVAERKPAIDEMWMIDPPARSRKGRAACEARTLAMRSTSMLMRQPSSSSALPKPEALFTRMSMPPSASAASFTYFVTAAASARSQAAAWTFLPFALSSASVLCSASAPRAQIETLAPQSAKPSAIERPMPRLAPVTMTFFPVKLMSISVLDAHLSEVRTRLQVRHGFLQLLERERAIEDGFYLVLLERAQHRLETVAVADRDSLQAHLPSDDEAELLSARDLLVAGRNHRDVRAEHLRDLDREQRNAASALHKDL